MDYSEQDLHLVADSTEHTFHHIVKKTAKYAVGPLEHPAIGRLIFRMGGGGEMYVSLEISASILTGFVAIACQYVATALAFRPSTCIERTHRYIVAR